jgi:hypothetical protein
MFGATHHLARRAAEGVAASHGRRLSASAPLPLSAPIDSATISKFSVSVKRRTLDFMVVPI